MNKKKVKVAAIQESKLTKHSKTPLLQNYTTVRKDRPLDKQGGGLLMFIHSSITFTKLPSARNHPDAHLEEQTISVRLGNTDLIISNVYIPPVSSCASGYQASIDHLLTAKDGLVLGDLNGHHPSWHSTSTDARGRSLADTINGSNYGPLNEDSPTRVPTNGEVSSPDVSLASSSLIAPSSWQTLSSLSSDHLPVLIKLQMKYTPLPGSRRTYINLKKADWDGYSKEVDDILGRETLPTDCQQHETIFRKALIKAASHHIPTGRHRLHEEPLPTKICQLMEKRDDIRSRDPTSSELPRLNDEIKSAISNHKRDKWREFVGTLDQRTNSTKLWRTIKSIDGRAKRQPDNEALFFNDKAISKPKLLANRFNQQFTTSKLGRHKSSKESRKVTRETKRKQLVSEDLFTVHMVKKAIKSCSNSKAFGPDKLSIFHLKNLGPIALEYLTKLFNLSVRNCQIPSIWKTSIIIPIPKPGKDLSQGASYRPISLLCPAAKVLENLILPSVNAHLHPAEDQHGFRSGHSTTSALLQVQTDIATGFNQKKPPHRTVLVAVDLSAAFDTVNHDNLIRKINASTLPSGTARWISCYLRGRQAKTSFRGAVSSSRKVTAGVPQGSKLSPALFSFYIADMPKPTEPIKRVCYADDITVWASGVKIPDLETGINRYLDQITSYLKENSLLLSAPKSTVTLFTPDTHQATKHPQIKIENTLLPLVRSPKILGVHLDTFHAFHKHAGYVADRVNQRNNVLKALAGTSWGQQKETLLSTYKAIGRSIINYAAPVWSPNASNTSFGHIQVAQNNALRIITGAHMMSSIDHLHAEANLLQVKDHSELLSAQYLAKCLEEDHVNFNITTRGRRPREMKETLYSKHYEEIRPLLTPGDTKKTLQTVHTHYVDQALKRQGNNRVLNDRPPTISSEETRLNRQERTKLAQLRSGHCRLLGNYKKRIGKDNTDLCPDCGTVTQDVRHLFSCPAHPTTLTLLDLWNRPADSSREFMYLDSRN